ncbi:MAG: FAD/NAD(P)-binding protein [Silanimonas sp.]
MPFGAGAHDLAVVGGGPAGLATVLAARSLAPHWRVLWCRGPADIARGFLSAFGGNSLVHRLNVPVERMGLDASAPVDFFDWLRREHPQRGVEPGQFVPRRWFGEYMAARAAGCGADERFGEVHDIARSDAGWRLTFTSDEVSDDGSGASIGARVNDAAHVADTVRTTHARRIALCLGMPAGMPMPNAPHHWVADPWAWWRSLGEGPIPLGVRDAVLVVGSGLTAVDMVLGLRERGYAGRIRVVSPGGRWSQAHAPAAPLDPEVRERFDDALDEAASAREVVRVLRRIGARHPWRAVIDALRADTHARWSALAPDEQRRLLRHAFGVWNRHRHRMAPDVRATLDGDPALSLEPGRIHVDAGGRIVKRDRGAATVVDVGLALDCRGPGFRSALAGDSLLARLVRGGVLEAHGLGTGVRSPDDASLAVVGAARFGERFETTAVPELRQQALEVVKGWVLSTPAATGWATASPSTP